ncbi:hypothetical protein ABT246_25640 [Streptomyces sp. NPDC001553]|uniref:hypothetical protein n=1 Tax=Streptomyces sp. NPDC001553 TaxID=3154385 RepID=UPI0033322C0E
MSDRREWMCGIDGAKSQPAVDHRRRRAAIHGLPAAIRMNDRIAGQITGPSQDGVRVNVDHGPYWAPNKNPHHVDHVTRFHTLFAKHFINAGTLDGLSGVCIECASVKHAQRLADLAVVSMPPGCQSTHDDGWQDASW